MRGFHWPSRLWHAETREHIKRTSTVTGVPVSVIVQSGTRRRTPEATIARYAVWHQVYYSSDVSKSFLARQFACDHATVINGIYRYSQIFHGIETDTVLAHAFHKFNHKALLEAKHG